MPSNSELPSEYYHSPDIVVRSPEEDAKIRNAVGGVLPGVDYTPPEVAAAIRPEEERDTFGNRLSEIIGAIRRVGRH